MKRKKFVPTLEEWDVFRMKLKSHDQRFSLEQRKYKITHQFISSILFLVLSWKYLLVSAAVIVRPGRWSKSVVILCSDWLRSWCCYASSLHGISCPSLCLCGIRVASMLHRKILCLYDMRELVSSTSSQALTRHQRGPRHPTLGQSANDCVGWKLRLK